MSTMKKIAVITGAGSGIGRTAAKALSAEGWSVVLAGRRESVLRETAEACGTSGSIVVPTDITDPQSVKALFDRVLEVYGRVDLLFNNAGINAAAQPLENLSWEEWRKVMDTNLTGAFLCTQQAFAIMKHQNPAGGRIINNGSVSAQVPRPHAA